MIIAMIIFVTTEISLVGRVEVELPWVWDEHKLRPTVYTILEYTAWIIKIRNNYAIDMRLLLIV